MWANRGDGVTNAARDESRSERWDDFVRWAARIYRWDSIDREERQYKLDIADRLREVRANLSADPERWQGLLKAAFGGKNNLVSYYAHLPFQEWCHAEPERAVRALNALWEPSRTALDSLYAFNEIVPKDLLRGPASQLNLASCLHMAKSPERYPVYQRTPLEKAEKLLGHAPSAHARDVPHRYQAALGLFDRTTAECALRGLELRDRLDAQSLLWSVTTWRVNQLPVSAWPMDEQTSLNRYRGGAE